MKQRRSLISILIVMVWCFVPPSTFAQCLYGADTCLQGYVWREASPNDHVCVTGAARTQAAADNSQADARRVSGSDGCQSGFVWREAFPGDHVCVTALTRAQTAVDNKRNDARRDLSCSACRNGREVVIPSTDATDPAVVVEFHFANGGLVKASSDSPLDIVKVPVSGSPVRIIAKATDEQGVKDVQLLIGTQKCSFGGGSASCSGPGLLVGPTASNPDAGTPGQTGCAERLVGHDVQVIKTPSRSVSHEVSVHALNFEDRKVSLPLIRLERR
jgi:hypothetical protein